MPSPLSGLDANFLYVETPTLHLHTLKVAVIQPGGPDGYSFELFREILGARLHLLPPFRRRAVMIPYGLYHPVWIEDATFDIDRHLHRVVLPEGATMRDLDAVVSEVAGRPLDRTRPLWEITAVEGLAGGRVGFIAKLHHALADGTAASELLMNVLLTDPNDAVEVAPPVWSGEAEPSRHELLRGAWESLRALLPQVPSLLGSTLGRVAKVVRHARSTEVEAAVPFRTPATPWNAALTANRIYATAELSLDEIKDVRKRHGATVNDVFLAVVTGALRRYLASHGRLAGAPLVAGVPANVGGDEPGRLSGNRVSNLFALLPVHLADPVERLRAISAAMQVAKERHAILGPELLHQWVELSLHHPSSTFMRLWSRLKLSDRVGSPINLVVSNVPGPRVPLYVAGASLVSLHSIGPILEGIGLNLTAWSYVDRLYVAAIACPEHVPDLFVLVDGLAPSLAELST